MTNASDLITSHRGAAVRYTEDVSEPECLLAFITLPDASTHTVTERLLRVVVCRGDKRHPTAEDRADIRRSFQAAVVARIDQELDRDFGSWAEVHH